MLFPAELTCFGRLGKPRFSPEEPMLPSSSFSRLYWENWQVFIMGGKCGAMSDLLLPFCWSFTKGRREDQASTFPQQHFLTTYIGSFRTTATGPTSLWALGDPALILRVDLKVVGVEMAPSIGHKTDLEHRDLQTMLKSPKTAACHWVMAISLLLLP